MGLMDKMKAQATQIAGKAQEAGKAGQAKIEALQARRRADQLLAELGKITYAERTGEPSAADAARIADLVEQLRQYEATYGSLSDDVDAEDSGTGGSQGGSQGGDETKS